MITDRQIADRICTALESRLLEEGLDESEVQPSVVYNSVYVCVQIGHYVLWDNQDENNWPEDDHSEAETFQMQMSHADGRIRELAAQVSALVCDKTDEEAYQQAELSRHKRALGVAKEVLEVFEQEDELREIDCILTGGREGPYR